MRVQTMMVVLLLSVPSIVSARDPAPRSVAEPAARPDRFSGVVRASLTGSDRGRLATARNSIIETSLGGFDLAAFASRVRSGAQDGNGFAARGSYRARAAGLTLSAPLAGGISVRSEAMLTRIKRHADVPVAYRARFATTAVAGVGLALDGGPSLMLDYVRTRSGGRLDPVERMVGIASGGPVAGDGLRLTLAGSAAEDEAWHVGWSLTGATMRRPAGAAGIDGNAAGYTDRRAELALRMAF